MRKKIIMQSVLKSVNTVCFVKYKVQDKLWSKEISTFSFNSSDSRLQKIRNAVRARTKASTILSACSQREIHMNNELVYV